MQTHQKRNKEVYMSKFFLQCDLKKHGFLKNLTAGLSCQTHKEKNREIESNGLRTLYMLVGVEKRESNELKALYMLVDTLPVSVNLTSESYTCCKATSHLTQSILYNNSTHY